MFKERKHKSFNYKPRFNASEAPVKKEDFKAKWQTVKPTAKRRKTALTSLPALLLFLIVVIVFLYFLNGYTA